MKSVWHLEFERAARSYGDEAERRRLLSKHDPVADALDYIAADLLERARVLADPTALRTVEEYAAEQLVTPQTVRNWIHAGELEHTEDARGFRIPAGAMRRRKEREHAA